MGCGDKKLSKYLTQTFTAHCNAMICQQVTLSGDAEWPKVADAVIEAADSMRILVNQRDRLGVATAVRHPMIATTIVSSVIVNPLSRIRMASHLILPPDYL